MTSESVGDYGAFLLSKSQAGADSGFAPVWMPDALIDFQQSLAEWAIRKGRAANMADCGLGKTLMGLTWASNVARKTGKPVLYLTPVAVAPQTIREGEKFGIECRHSRDGNSSGHIVVTNYEKLHLFSAADFSGVVCDESSILKSFAGQRRGEITPFMGVGSEVYSPVLLGRRGMGAELKPSYYRQAVKNVQMAAAGRKDIETSEAFDFEGAESA